MKRVLLVGLALLGLAGGAFAQLNMTLLSHIQYDANGNDIWGWVAPDSTEYAIMGLVNGVSIVSLADPSNATEVAFIPGQYSTWRDIKTWGNFAYVTTDQSGTTEGLTVIDMSNLPESVEYYRWTPDIPGLGVLQTCHNLYIDEFGYCYLSGCNLNSGGILYIDVFSQPGTPIYINHGFNIYSHDVYVRNNRMYTSEIYGGDLGIYDVSDKANTQLLGRQQTPFEFTHNSWLSDDGMVAFTTDERANAPIGAYDVSDPEDIIELDQFRPLETLGEGVIPHNVHVWQNWLIISYYTDGGIVADASRPTNIIEVGNFDTFLGVQTGFNGAWGAYPFLPSGTVLVSDINSGLYVLAPNYVRACWLEGVVTDAVTNLPINGVMIQIVTDEANGDDTNAAGKYETGLATAGQYAVNFQKEGYEALTVSAELNNGVLTILNVQMVPLTPVNFGGQVVDAATGAPVPNARILMQGELSSFSTTADANGIFSLSNVFADDYEVIAGAWGYLHKNIASLNLSSDINVTIELDRGYQDDFVFDQGWTATLGTPAATSGAWVRGEPNGTFSNGSAVNPNTDVDFDLGNACYVTGNANVGGIGDDDVDGGIVILTSPEMDLSAYVDPFVQYNLWFANTGGNNNPDDQLVVKISNGIETVAIETVTQSLGVWRDRSSLRVANFVDFTAGPVTISVETADLPGNGHVVEAGFDAFLVSGDFVSDLETPAVPLADAKVLPNPFVGSFTLDYNLGLHEGELVVHNALGQAIAAQALAAGSGLLSLGESWAPGCYFLQLRTQGQLLNIGKVIKQ